MGCLPLLQETPRTKAGVLFKFNTFSHCVGGVQLQQLQLQQQQL